MVPVDLEILGNELEGDPSMSAGGYVDLRTGEVYDDSSTDPMMVGEEEPDRWLRFDCTGPRGRAGGTCRPSLSGTMIRR
nr:hypothetical protein GCM10017611_61660 [Rhodococcus wratislaviensis]